MLKVQFAAMQRMTGWTARVAAIHGLCSEWQLRARLGHCDFVLRALAAQKLQRVRKIRFHLAAGDAAIHACRSIDQKPNLHTAGRDDLYGTQTSVFVDASF